MKLPVERLMAARPAFTTRRVPLRGEPQRWSNATLLTGAFKPQAGDLVLAEVTKLGHHRRLELPTGRRPKMETGGEIIVAYGDRYAPDQFEAEIPTNLGPTNLAASGGVAATVLTRHGSTRKPTELTPVGLLGDANGVPLNLADFALPTIARPRQRPPVIGVLGTSMNAGKTTAVASLIAGMAAAGEAAGGTKVTGTGSGGDLWSMVDHGAHQVFDFTDAGMTSTYRVDVDTIERGATNLVSHLHQGGASVVIMEVADGIYQLETFQLIRRPALNRLVDGWVFAAGDAVGAVGGVAELQALGLTVLGVTGAFTQAPLAMREVQAHCPVPVLSRPDLMSAEVASRLVATCRAAQQAGSAPSRPAPRPMRSGFGAESEARRTGDLPGGRVLSTP